MGAGRLFAASRRDGSRQARATNRPGGVEGTIVGRSTAAFCRAPAIRDGARGMSNYLRTGALRLGTKVGLPPLVGPLLLLVMVIALELPTPRFLRVVNPTPLILLLVVLAAFLGGA